MAKLTEKYVQDAALDFLKNYYMDKYKLDKIFKKYNIGILIVSAKQKVEIVLDTKDINMKKDTNYLKYYSISKKCEEELSKLSY